jgi:Glyoxalase-like domain
VALDIQVTFDVHDLEVMSRFWALALDYEEEPPPPGFSSWEDLAERNQIPTPPVAGGRGRPRAHAAAAVLPAGAGGPDGRKQGAPRHPGQRRRGGRSWPKARPGHAQRLVEAGATVLHEQDEPIGWCIVMRDPEGNEFCMT